MLKKDYDKLKKLKKSQESLQASLLQTAIANNNPRAITQEDNKDNNFLIAFLSFIVISSLFILL